MSDFKETAITAGTGTAGALAGSTISQKLIDRLLARKPLGTITPNMMRGRTAGTIGGAVGGSILANKIRQLLSKPKDPYEEMIREAIGKSGEELIKAAGKKREEGGTAKTLATAALAGLGVGSLKGLAEKNLESALAKALKKLPAKVQATRGVKGVPWALARGLASAGGGIPYGLVALFAAREAQKK